MFKKFNSFIKKSYFIPIILLATLFVFRGTGILFAATPAVTTGSASSITKTSADLNGSITDMGGESIIDAGFEYGMTTSYGDSVSASLSYASGTPFGSVGTADGEFNAPTGIAVDSSGNIYVVDSANNRVQKFDSSGNWILNIVGDSGDFDSATGVYVDANDKVYVSDAGNGRVQKFSSAGVFELEIGTGTLLSGANAFGSVATDSSGNIYVADHGASTVYRFDSDGNYVDNFADGQHATPYSVAIDSSDNVYVADAGVTYVQKFNSSGNSISFIGSGADGTLFTVFVDQEDNVYITSTDFHTVTKYDSAGSLVETFGSGSSGSGVGEMDGPSASAVSLTQQILIADTQNNRVQIFERSGIDSTNISGLTCGTTYHFRAYAENIDGASYGNDNTFTTSDCEPPEVDTEAATNIDTNYVTLNGFDLMISESSISSVDRGFEYGLDTSYGQTVFETSQFITDFGSTNFVFGAINSSDNIYTPFGDHIEIFNSSGVVQSQFGSFGSGEGQFSDAFHLAIDSSDNVYVADRGNNRIQKFDPNGNFLFTFGWGVATGAGALEICTSSCQAGTSGTDDGRFDSPLSVSIDSSDNVYVADRGNNRIQKFDSSGNYLSQFGSTGTGNGEFTAPVALAFDSSGNIYVSDNGDVPDGRIQKFDSSGLYISSFSGLWDYVGDDGYLAPFIDIDGSIYITGRANVVKTDSSGNIISYIRSAGGIFVDNFSVILDSKDNIYIGTRKYNRNFYSNVSSLSCGKTYHYRAFATNAEGTDYGDDMTFTTDDCLGGGVNPPPKVYGCTIDTAINYNSSANIDDGSCIFPDPPQVCLDPDATNYHDIAECIYNPGAITGCTDPSAGNYDLTATVDNGTCLYGVFGCTDSTASNYNSSAEYDDGSCIIVSNPPTSTDTFGCTNSTASNYNSSATVDDGSCEFSTTPQVFGCIDSSATNFDPSADINDGSCLYPPQPEGPSVWTDILGGAGGAVEEIPEEILTGVSVVGIVAPGLLLNFLQPGLLAGIVSISLRLWNLIPVLMGYKRKKRPWGTVYDSVTKQPLDPVYVKLLDEIGQEKGTSITDLDGRYGFLAPAGMYNLLPNKDNYIFPSQKLSGKDKDDLYDNLYFGGNIELTEKEGVIYKNIPMDALNFNWNEFAKAENKKLMKFYSKRDLFFARIATTLFVTGLVSSVLLFLVNSTILNSLILTFYAIIILLRIFGIKPKQAGRAYDSDSNPLSFGIIRLFSAALGREVAHTVIGKTGRYYMLVPNGTYFMKVMKKIGEDSYEEVLTTKEFGVRGGYVHRKIVV